MCLPLRFLKCVVTFNAIITLLLSTAIVIVGIVGWVKFNGDYKNALIPDMTDVKNGLIYSIFFFGLLLFLFSIFGIIGAKKKKNCCLLVFNCGVTLSFMLFLVIGVLALALTNKYFENEDCSTGMTKEIQDLNTFSSSQFCKDKCPCYIKPDTFT